MLIEELKYRVRDVFRGFRDNEEDGVVAFSGNLDVRPPYQREFIYPVEKQQKVIETIMKGHPLNVFYWGTTGISGRYELIDGQQRTMSICRFLAGKYSVKYKDNDVTFIGLPQDIQDEILNYELTIYKCDGTDSEKLEWFETINIASEALTPQELRNAVYTGAWLSSAKKYFSRTGCPAVSIAGDYIKGVPNRQEILEEVLKWVADAYNMKITEYMDEHKNDADATRLWDYFLVVMEWVKNTFGQATKEMKNVRWGVLYNKYHSSHYVDDQHNIVCHIGGVSSLHTQAEFLSEIQRLQDDDDVTSRQGIFEYVLSGDERKLSIRKFPDKVKMKKFKQQGGYCAICKRQFAYEDLVADHITPWSKGGRTMEGNCQLLCVECNTQKSNKSEAAVNEVACSHCGKPVKVGMFCQYCGTRN